MNSRSGTLRRPREPAELVTPLSGSVRYGPVGIARVRWRKPLEAILADVVANNEGLLAHLAAGLYCPDVERKPYYEDCLNVLFDRTEEQLKALETFRAIGWRDR